jgi:peroxiredoxin
MKPDATNEWKRKNVASGLIPDVGVYPQRGGSSLTIGFILGAFSLKLPLMFRRFRRKWLFFGGMAFVLLILAGAGAFLGLRFRQPPEGVEPGFTAPDFSLPDLSGREIRLSQFRGKPILLYFWQSTCPDCRKALPEVLSLREELKTKGLVLLTVNLDYYEEDLRNYLDRLGDVDFPILRGSYEAAMKVVDLFQVPYVPHIVFLDRRGVIRFRGTYPAFPKAADLAPWL